MNKHLTGLTIATFSVIPALFAGESVADKPQGFRFFNQHLTIKPYVSLSYTYDSNIDTSRHAEGDSIFCIQPGADFEWKGERWALVGSLWYRRNAYCEYSNEMGENSYGESLAYKWTTSKQDERGWSLILAEKYRYSDQSDALGSGDGRGVWRDREALDASGILQRRFNERLHAEILAQYNWLDYKNDTGKYAPLYGWSEYAVGAQAGYAASKWTDFLVAGGYAHYTQKKGRGYRNYSNDSQVWTVQAGLGTHATEKITYRALMGVSWLEYGGHANADCGWTYSLDANWRITRQLQFSVLGKSYYQPSERTVGQAIKVYSLSGGLSYLTLGDKMTLTANVAWRYEDTCYSDRYLGYGNNFDEDILSVRLGANYTINRWMSVFADFTWEEEWCDVRAYGYDRFRGTIGMRFHY
ncbi:MAG: outer membrane beta-barrel protein [Kiritimatiellae bacterium]|nr:outer membrane beta-barrel protein [Kiritimatiellia bacterium]